MNTVKFDHNKTHYTISHRLPYSQWTSISFLPPVPTPAPVKKIYLDIVSWVFTYWIHFLEVC